MERQVPYDDLELECYESVPQKNGIFGGIFKRSSKAVEAVEDKVSISSQLSNSNGSLTDNNNTKDNLDTESDAFEKTNSISERNGGGIGKIFRNPFIFSSKENRSVGSELSGSKDSLSENTKTKDKDKAKIPSTSSNEPPICEQHPAKQERDADSGEVLDGEHRPGSKQNVFVGAIAKLNPFRSAVSHNKKETGSDEPPADPENLPGNKQVKSSPIHSKETVSSDPPAVPHRPSREETTGSSAEGSQLNRNMFQRENQGQAAKTPPVPLQPTDKEPMEAVRIAPLRKGKMKQQQTNDEGLQVDEGQSSGDVDGETVDTAKGRKAKVNKSKPHQPFLPGETATGKSEDEPSLLKKEHAEKDKVEEKVTKRRKRNPFLPATKGKAVKKNERQGDKGTESSEDAVKRSLFDQLDDFRTDRTDSDDDQDVDGLMEWWNTVEQWEDTPQEEDRTEKEEAKAFAVTAEKVQKGIRVFNKLFSERAESLWQHVIDLNTIADALDKFTKKTKIAQITGGSTSAVGGVATITGLALAPVTMGTSLIVTAVGLAVATAGGLTSAGAGISNQVNNSLDRKKVEKIVQDYQEKMNDINKCMLFIKQGIESLQQFDLIKLKKQAYNRDFPALNNIYEDGAMAGKAILINANEIMRVVQIANVAGSTAARAVQIASMATGVLTGLFVAMDIYFVAKDSKELKKGAKSDFAAKIREVALQLHDGLVELNRIREELQSADNSKDTANQDASSAGSPGTENTNKGDTWDGPGTETPSEWNTSDTDDRTAFKNP